MKPYYDEDGITIYNARCEDVLPSLSDVGLVLTSPPYNLRSDGNVPTGTRYKAMANGYADYGDDLPQAEYVEWQHRCVSLMWGTLADDGAIFYNHKPVIRGKVARLPTELVPDGIPLRQIVIWDRLSGHIRNGAYFVPCHEWVLMLARPSFRLTTASVFDVWHIPQETGSEHPAPFPLKFAQVAIGSTGAATVLDPFAGSGTTLVAAKSLGRRAIGIELSERYCEIAAKRLAQGVLDFGAAS